MAIVRVKTFIRQYPVAKGMLAYSILWPTSNICQQAIQGREHFDFEQAARFSIFGTFVVAPCLYTWMKIASLLVPGNSVKAAVAKALLDQIIYAPFGITLFYTGMTLLENKTLEDAINEVKAKFWPTYKIRICLSPIVQTINFAYVKERNRVPFISLVSFFWTIFLSYMKQLETAGQQK